MFNIPDPQFLLQPWKSLKQFTEELYATLRASQATAAAEQAKPKVVRAPESTIAVRRSTEEAATAVSVRRAKPTPTTSLSAPATAQASGAAWSESHTQQLPPLTERERRNEADVEQALYGKREDRPLTKFKDSNEAPRTKDDSTDEPYFHLVPKKAGPPFSITALPDYKPDLVGDGGGGGGLMARIVEGSGKEYRAVLFPDGPKADSGDEVDLYIPQLDDSEQIPPDTWVSGVIEFDDYYSVQVPIWIA